MKLRYAAVAALYMMSGVLFTACTADQERVKVCNMTRTPKVVIYVNQSEADAQSYSRNLNDCNLLKPSDLPKIAKDLATITVIINKDGSYGITRHQPAPIEDDTRAVKVIKDNNDNDVDDRDMIMIKLGTCFTGVALNEEGRLVLKSGFDTAKQFSAIDDAILSMAPHCL